MSEGHGVNTNEIARNGESVKFDLSSVTEKAINDLRAALEAQINAIPGGGGTVEPIDSATSTSTTQPPTAKALKGVNDKVTLNTTAIAANVTATAAATTAVNNVVNIDIPALKLAGAKERVNVATKCKTHTAGAQTASHANINSTSATYRSKHVILRDCTDIELNYDNITGDKNTPGANPIAIECVIEKVDVGGVSTFYPQTFNGSASNAINPGAIVKTDSFGMEFSANEIIFVRTLVSVASLSDKWPTGLVVNPYALNNEGIVPGNHLLDTTIKWVYALTAITAWSASVSKAIGIQVRPSTTGRFFYEATIAGTTGTTEPIWPTVEDATIVDGTVTWKTRHVVEGLGMYGFTPTAITAKTYKPEISVGIAGDSISNGAGDRNAAYNNIADNYGFIIRALEASNIGYTSFGYSGQQTTNFMGANRLYISPLLETCTHFIGSYGINDVNKPTDAATIKANIIDICKMARRRGLKVYWTTLAPLSTSTDVWATIANQTAKFPLVRAEINNWLRGGADGYIDGCIDSGAAVEEGTDTGIWKVGHVLTSDNLGIHPNHVGHPAMAQPVLQAISTWKVT
jgi:lysophospholipase L1-like esterase